MLAMSTRTVNLLLLVCLAITGFSGIGSFLVGHPDGQWVFWTHRIASLAMIPLMWWKIGIIVRSYAKRGITVSTVLSAVSAFFFVLTFSYGVLWATVGVVGGRLPLLGNTSGLGLHVTFAGLFAPLLIVHVINRWGQIRARAPDFAKRRMAMRYAIFGAAGLFLWRGAETTTARIGWDGAERRFTGSKPRGRFTGNDYPTVNWLSDPHPRIQADEWRLQIDGLVRNQLALSMADFQAYEQMSVEAILDCTGGWFTEQRWTGVPVRALLDVADVADSARSVVFHSETGYRRRYSLRQARGMLLAVEVTGEELSRRKGYPVRLIAPGQRGFGWVKWVVRIELSELPGWVESPLPLQ